MKSIYRQFRDSVRRVTHYYVLLVEETKSQRLVGSTNEWVLDNYYMISEQEKVLNVELRSREWRRIGTQRLRQLQGILQGYLRKCHHEVDKPLFFRYVSLLQASEHDYLSYAEVCALVPLMKCILIEELAALCDEMEREKAYHYSVTGKEHADKSRLDAEARRNLMIMNIFNSLKKMTRIQTSEVIDSVSFSEKVLKGEAAAMYDQMYDKTKEDYRARIARMARRKGCDEYELVKRLVAEADEQGQHVGWQLFPAKRWAARARWYVAIVAVATLALSVLVACLLCSGWVAAVAALLLMIPVSQVVIDLFNQLLSKLHKPMGTFRLKFKDGMIPQEYTTMVIMPTILKSAARVEELLGQLEVYYLSNINRAGSGAERLEGVGQNLYYTLVGDAAAYGSQDAPWDDEVAEAGRRKVRELNEKYGADIFNFVYRRRAWSDGEGCWLGYERKRGAIMHFNDLLLGLTGEADRESRFKAETISAWRDRQGMAEGRCSVEFVITLDTDTELVLYSAQRLIGAMAHPLNRAKLSDDGRKVVSGYGIMQPRVSVDVEVTNKSRYAQLMCGLGGLDVYTSASFELYQDIFNEGSFCGKGIYDLRVFHDVLGGAFPENLILSHDLLEGCHVRCGLINDVELFDDNPSNYIDDAKRQHRWTRGDWQIVQWLGRRVHDASGAKRRNVVNLIGRWKIFDNLRRSLLSASALLLIAVAYVLPYVADNFGLSNNFPAWMVLVALLVLASPIVFFILTQLTKVPNFGRRYHYYTTLLRGFKVIIYRSLVQFAIMPREAWMRSDAIVRSCYRMAVSHKNLLNWVPSDEASKGTKGTLGEYAAKFWPNYVAAAAVLALSLAAPSATPICVLAALFCALSWCAAPAVMWSLGRRLHDSRQRSLGEKEKADVRELARHTWHFFDTLMTEQTNYLIPDNYQHNRENKTDYKTSPTNIGYSLTAIVSAAQMGFIDTREALTRIGRVLETVRQLEKWNGHLFNWYDVRSLAKLPNYFVSTADSGNFVACLYVVKGWLAELQQERGNAADEKLSALAQQVSALIVQTDFRKLYNAELDVFSIGYDWGLHQLLPYHYNNFASEARLTSFMTIAQGDAPYRHWFCLDKTLVQYHGYKGVASWYGTLFEYFMPFIFLPTFKHTLMDETYSFAIRAQQSFVANVSAKGRKGNALPWGISETAYNELDDAQNYKYHAFGVPYLKFQNTTPDRIVISPYSSIMTIGIDDRAVYLNLQRFRKLDMVDPSGFGLYESYDDEDRVPVRAHYAHHQGMILASLANYLCDNCVQRYFMSEPVMRSMETLLKEKAQVKPYIDLKVTQYKRYQYSKVETESDARDYTGVSLVPEIGIVSNGLYTVLLNDRGSGFSRYRDIMLNRYRKISSDHYGQYLYVRNMASDHLWSATFAPLDVEPAGYRVSFASDKVTYQRIDGDVETKTEITVFKERSAELRRYTFTNRSSRPVDLEITTYGEVVLAREAEDVSHRVFNAMKISSEYDAASDALFFSRPGDADTRHYMAHRLWVGATSSTDLDTQGSSQTTGSLSSDMLEYETSRIKFLGRGGSLRHADVIESRRTLSKTVGTTLDPVFSMRRRLHLAPQETVEAYAITAFAKSKEQLASLMEQCQSKVDVEHVFRTASVYNNMRTSLSLLKGAQMRLYNSIAKYMAQTATLGSDRNALLATNTLSQSGLWRFGISGDLAILLMEVDSIDRSGFAKEMLRAFEYFKVHGMRLDLVFINDVPQPNHDGLTHFIRSMADTERLWSTHSDAGRVFILDGATVTPPERILLRTVARLAFSTAHGLTIEQQLRRLEEANLCYQDKEEYPILRPQREMRVWSNLDFYNQYGGYDNAGRDYVVTNTNTPMPWVNVIANPGFGCVVSSTMAGFTFAYNAQQFKLTSWSNDMVRDTPSEMLLIDGQRFLPATARHGQGFSAFDADSDGLHVDVRLFVAVARPDKYYHIRVVNKGSAPRNVRLDMVCKFVLGMSEEQTSRYLYSQWDETTNSLYVRNVYHPIYSGTTVRITSSEPLTERFLDYPNRKRLGLVLPLKPAESREVIFVIGVAQKDASASSPQPIHPVTVADAYSEFDSVRRFWDDRLSHIQVQTPDTAFNYMLNRWYLYQVCSSRLFARAGFYQVGGATGFRDQLQDVMSLLYSDPGYARRQILDHAAHQFAEGDVLHWWHESMLLGARTTFSDDYLWLIFVTHQYVTVTGDVSILAEQVPFCQADQLAPGEAERGMNYRVPDKSLAHDPAFEYATLYEHLRRAAGRAMTRRGIHGLPLMGCGDWNDGMSRVGVQGKGESVWVAFFLADLMPKLAELTQLAARIIDTVDLAYCEELSAFRSQIVDAIQKHAWDGDSDISNPDSNASRGWFLRAYYDNGDAMGSRNNTECQIDLICQAWSVLTNVATPQQKATVLRETDRRLVNREHEIIQLLTPPFQHSNPSPGYIMNYPAGVRENGGQYTHGAMWYIMAQLQEGNNDMAYFLYSLINPIHRTCTLADVLKYKVEPYCIAADIYSNPQHPGRGGWTWYTGSASWAYKTGIENILGFHKQGDTLTIDPHVPSDWDAFTITYRYGNTLYTIHCSRSSGTLQSPATITLTDDAQEHRLEIKL